MNSGYNPILFEPVKTSQNQAQSQQPPFYFGGSQVLTALGFTPIIKPVATKPKPIKINRISSLQ
jgi:hypothetical protein